MFDFECAPTPVAEAPQAGVQGCAHDLEMSVEKHTFQSGEPIVVHFKGGPENRKDWIAAYPRNQSVVSGSTIWKYVANDSHSGPSAGAAEGWVTLDESATNDGADWPLPAGSAWTLYFLLDDGYTAVASTEIEIAP